MLVHRGAAELPLPPVELRFMGESDEQFLAIGDAIADQLEEWAGLEKGDRVLDVGCGYGRLAHALKRRSFRGSYLGLDILPRQIRWCRRNLSGWRWRFRHMDVRNLRYNPGGKLAAETLSLGRYCSSVDLVVASSLFTHLEAASVRHYLREFVSLLAAGGAIYASFFALNSRFESAGAGEDVSVMSFAHELGDGARYQYLEEPLRAVAYEETWLEELFESSGLEVRERSYGSWCPGAPGAHYQDIYILGAR